MLPEWLEAKFNELEKLTQRYVDLVALYEHGCCSNHGHISRGSVDRCIAILPSGEACPCEQYVMSVETRRKVNTILEGVALRLQTISQPKARVRDTRTARHGTVSRHLNDKVYVIAWDNGEQGEAHVSTLDTVEQPRREEPAVIMDERDAEIARLRAENERLRAALDGR